MTFILDFEINTEMMILSFLSLEELLLGRQGPESERQESTWRQA